MFCTSFFTFLFDVIGVNLFMCYYANSVLYAKAAGMKIDKVLISFPINPLTALIYYCCVNVLYYCTKMDIERYYKYLFTLTSILKCNFTSRLWFELSFLKAVIILLIVCRFLFFVVVVVFVCVFEEAGS